MSRRTRYGRRTRKTSLASWGIPIWTCTLAVGLHWPAGWDHTHFVINLSGLYRIKVLAYRCLAGNFEKSDGARYYPVTATVANLAKSTSEKPSLMRHDAVVTFFHEMGQFSMVYSTRSNTIVSKAQGTAQRCCGIPCWCWSSLYPETGR